MVALAIYLNLLVFPNELHFIIILVLTAPFLPFGARFLGSPACGHTAREEAHFCTTEHERKATHACITHGHDVHTLSEATFIGAAHDARLHVLVAHGTNQA